MKCFSAIVLVAGLFLACKGLMAQQPRAYSPYGYPRQEIDQKLCSPTCKMCVCETKPATRKVFASKYEEYCLPRCALCPLLCGHCGGDSGPCGDLRLRHRLIVKRVEDCNKRQCVPREVPASCSVFCPSGNPFI